MSVSFNIHKVVLAFISLLMVTSCAGPTEDSESGEKEGAQSTNNSNKVETEVQSGDFNATGSWKLIGLEGEKVPEGATDCDRRTEWNFTKEKMEPLGDGTEVYKLVVTAPEDCKWYDFEAKWTEVDGQLFISSTRVNGMGGISNAGLFEIVEGKNDQMVLEILGTRYSFQRN